ncbi:hypothetical protein NQ318_018076 [Aromia moschata]|uniref:Uncharacterized protein n=1 Tax=Aromia moschata TaxID=1265417 RepID=A0AAV8ZCK6_9CUCU|nr:hypothetical protein NQ318_018076 [Aromia moschata]
MHDGAPPHFSIMVRDFLNHQYPNKCIGRRNNCPQNRITDKCNVIRNNQRLLERVDFNFRRRINLCLRETGDHFEQFL